MQSDLFFYLVIGVAVIILGLSKGGFAGVGMISTPMLALVVGPIAAAGLIFPILIIQDVIAVAMYRRTFDRQILTRLPSDRRGVFSCGWMEAYLVGLRGSLLESVARLTPKTSKRIDERYRCIAVDGGGLRSSLQGQALDMGALRARWVRGPVDDRSPR